MDRDSEAIIESVRLRDYTGPLARTFVDANVDDVERVTLQRLPCFPSEGALFPQDGFGCGFAVVSMPKLKTHHWAGEVSAFTEEHVWGGAWEAPATGGLRTYCTGRELTARSWT